MTTRTKGKRRRAPKALLSAPTRDEIERWVADSMRDSMFGDGQEDEWIWDGFPRFPGINYMSDRALVAGLAMYVGDEDDAPDGENSDVDLLRRARAELRAAAPRRKRR